MSKLYQNRAWLTKKYTIEKLTVVEIAKEAGCSVATVQAYLTKFGLIFQPRTWTNG